MIDKPKYKAFIFDFDGVIVDSERWWPEVENRIYKDVAPLWTDEHHEDILAMGFKDLHTLLTSSFGCTLSYEEFEQYENTMAEDVYSKSRLTTGFADFLHETTKVFPKRAIASSSRKRWILPILEKYSLTELFSTIQTTEGYNTGEGKPHPAIFLNTATALAADPADCIVIEDATLGVSAAKAAGMYCIGYRNDYNRQDLSAADMVVSAFTEIDLNQLIS